MNNCDVNSILLSILILLALAALAIWISPRGCRRISLYLYCRAEAIDAGREAFTETMRANVEARRAD